MNHMLKEVSYKSRQYFALLKCPFTAALYSLKQLREGLPFMRPGQTPFYDLLQSKAEQMSTFSL